jgi:hypothetical protein
MHMRMLTLHAAPKTMNNYTQMYLESARRQASATESLFSAAEVAR